MLSCTYLPAGFLNLLIRKTAVDTAYLLREALLGSAAVLTTPCVPHTVYVSGWQVMGHMVRVSWSWNTLRVCHTVAFACAGGYEGGLAARMCRGVKVCMWLVACIADRCTLLMLAGIAVYVCDSCTRLVLALRALVPINVLLLWTPCFTCSGVCPHKNSVLRAVNNLILLAVTALLYVALQLL